EHRDVRRDAEYSYALEHFLVAEQLRFAGRDDDALAWYASFGDDFSYDIAFIAPSYLYRAGIHDRLNQRARAIACYEAFLRIWNDPDPELRTLTDRARARIAALRLAGG
ncbi:MAG TPA: hypothetical protein VK928_00825, partial [Longimicrobiales bacterium]|nr:hypothetical protein [Longimicrobiales bacterium]